MGSPTDERTVTGAFQSYMNMLFKGMTIGPVQKSELEKAFYAGAWWLFTLQTVYVSELEEDKAMAFLEDLQQQFLQFAASLSDNGPGGLTDEPVVQPPH